MSVMDLRDQPPDSARRRMARQNKQEPAGLLASLADMPCRVRDIAALRGLGYTFRDIGDLLSITPQAVSLMLTRYRRQIKSGRNSDQMARLSTRAYNVLSKHGITRPTDPRLPQIVGDLHQEKNCGAKTVADIRRWMGEKPADSPALSLCADLPN